VRLLDRSIAPAITRVAQCVGCGEQHGGPGERSNERARDIGFRSAHRCNVLEEQTCHDGADDTQSEVHHDTLAGTLEEPEGDIAGDESRLAPKYLFFLAAVGHRRCVRYRANREPLSYTLVRFNRRG
jgi:hypothetical protein